MITLGKGALANHDWGMKVENGDSLDLFNEEKILRPDANIKTFEAYPLSECLID
ncbi:hypothetical protein [Paenibacillus amylolyticus]|uniref:NADH:flavin oxidoreductase n=1 Tax=Paenibacillus amylolyticus TaxID=1451 RepID=A0A100VLQ0_PAEAM|nr:hypothetical protein [Paenibacillus amylolyticus]GAS82049.1 NADH:flavin oxidoreductase [Paenibacillus amylolyticus]